MWPFRRGTKPTTELVRRGEPSTDLSAYSVLTVGQARLGGSFDALGFVQTQSPWFTWAVLTPLVDPRMKLIADVTVTVDGQIVGYLRPPALDDAIRELTTARAASLEVPAVLVWGPTGPEVYLRALTRDDPNRH